MAIVPFETRGNLRPAVNESTVQWLVRHAQLRWVDCKQCDRRDTQNCSGGLVCNVTIETLQEEERMMASAIAAKRIF